MKIKSEPTQVTIKDIKVVDFFDDKFIGIMKKHLPDFNFLIFGMYTFDEKCKPDKRIMVSTKIEEDPKKNVVSIDTDESEILKKMLEAIEDYYKDK